MENEVLIAENQVSGKGSTLWSQVSCHKDREEATPFIMFGKLSKCESSVRKQIFSVYELSQETFLLFNFLLCSLMCEMYITLQWCFTVVPTETKTRPFGLFFFFFGCTGSISCMAISLFETSGGYSLLAGCMASHCSGFFCCGAPALGTHTSVVLLHRLSICPSSA